MLQPDEMLFPRLSPCLVHSHFTQGLAWGGWCDVLQRPSGAGGFPAWVYKCKCHSKILQPHIFAVSCFWHSLPGEKNKNRCWGAR